MVKGGAMRLMKGCATRSNLCRKGRGSEDENIGRVQRPVDGSVRHRNTKLYDISYTH